jgi:hypothetical protein
MVEEGEASEQEEEGEECREFVRMEEVYFKRKILNKICKLNNLARVRRPRPVGWRARLIYGVEDTWDWCWESKLSATKFIAI